MLIGQSTVPAGIGVDLRPVKRHCAHLQHAHLTRQQQHLHKQAFDLLHKALSERGDCVVIGMLVCSDKAQSHRAHYTELPTLWGRK